MAIYKGFTSLVLNDSLALRLYSLMTSSGSLHEFTYALVISGIFARPVASNHATAILT